MSIWQWLLLAGGVALALYTAALLWLWRSGRPGDARALASLAPDLVVLFRRLLADERTPARRRAWLGLVAVYLASPIDLVPDFIPVIGHLDDAVVVVLVLRALLRASGPEAIREHWPGSPRALELLLRVAAVPSAHGR